MEEKDNLMTAEMAKVISLETKVRTDEVVIVDENILAQYRKRFTIKDKTASRSKYSPGESLNKGPAERRIRARNRKAYVSK